MTALSLIGKSYGYLEVLRETRNHIGVRSWLCRCVCGGETVVTTSNLRCKASPTVSCGCKKKDRAKLMSKGESLEKRKKSLSEYWKSEEGKKSIKNGADKRKLMMANGSMIVWARGKDSEYFSSMQKKVDQEKLKEINRANGLLKRGVPMTSEICKKGVSHHAAKKWVIKNVDTGVVLDGINLSQLIRDNINLFDKEDVSGIIDGFSCKATKRIGELRRKYNHRVSRSWKGWVYISDIV